MPGRHPAAEQGSRAGCGQTVGPVRREKTREARPESVNWLLREGDTAQAKTRTAAPAHTRLCGKSPTHLPGGGRGDLLALPPQPTSQPMGREPERFRHKLLVDVRLSPELT